ncbi:hypothetical protein HMPREF1154_2431 [Capnocytophaga sp. CM59]|nr:hypothetical protein HMPREF1154_2431 [Capnocytophaga sp. CM59]
MLPKREPFLFEGKVKPVSAHSWVWLKSDKLGVRCFWHTFCGKAN